MVSKILLVRNVIQEVLGIKITPEDADTIIARIEALQAEEAVEQSVHTDGGVCACEGVVDANRGTWLVCGQCLKPRRQ